MRGQRVLPLTGAQHAFLVLGCFDRGAKTQFDAIEVFVNFGLVLIGQGAIRITVALTHRTTIHLRILPVSSLLQIA